MPYLRPGSWVGGDRDGNPNVSPDTLDYAVRRQAEVILDHYLREIHALGAELSLSDSLVKTSDAHAWPELYFQGAGWLRIGLDGLHDLLSDREHKANIVDQQFASALGNWRAA